MRIWGFDNICIVYVVIDVFDWLDVEFDVVWMCWVLCFLLDLKFVFDGIVWLLWFGGVFVV